MTDPFTPRPEHHSRSACGPSGIPGATRSAVVEPDTAVDRAAIRDAYAQARARAAGALG